MDKSELVSDIERFSQGVISIRLWEEQNLPISQSRIAFDLFALLAKCNCTQRPLTLKDLFNSLNYSERGVRYVMEQFIRGGWCEVICDSADKRCRFIVPTKRLTDAFEAYQKVVLSTYMGCVVGDK